MMVLFVLLWLLVLAYLDNCKGIVVVLLLLLLFMLVLLGCDYEMLALEILINGAVVNAVKFL